MYSILQTRGEKNPCVKAIHTIEGRQEAKEEHDCAQGMIPKLDPNHWWLLLDGTKGQRVCGGGGNNYPEFTGQDLWFCSNRIQLEGRL